jgi:hypothetical protein
MTFATLHRHLLTPGSTSFRNRVFKNSVSTSKKTRPSSITRINWSIQLKEVMAVYSESYEIHSTHCENLELLRV